MWNRKISYLLFTIFILSTKNLPSVAARLYPEKSYQEYWCNKYSGQTEVKLEDDTRVDCLLNNYAIEFDFANKWNEAIGQSLYYGLSTNKKAGIVLILENPQSEQRYLQRLLKVANNYNITVWTITSEELACYFHNK